MEKGFPLELEMGFLKLDEDGKIIYMDEGASSLLNLSSKGLKEERFLWEFLRPLRGKTPSKDIFQSFLKRLKDEGGLVSYNICLSPEGKPPFYAILRGKLVSEGEGKLIYVALVKPSLEREVYLRLLEDVPMALFRISLDNKFEFISDEGAKAILGYEAKDLIGKDVSIIHFDKVVAENLFREINRALLERDSIKVGQLLLKRSDGSPVWVTSVVRGIYDEKGRLLGREGVMIRSSFLELLRESLNDGDNLLSMIGHDVRVLAGTAASFLGLLLKTELNELQRDLVNKAYASISGVRRLLENYIYSYRVRTGRIEVLELPFDINDVIESLRTILTPHLKKGVELKVKVPEFPYLLIGDSLKLEQILLNLLVNSAKFTEEGFIELSVEKLEENERVELLFSVRDTGPGIPEEIRDVIFSPFKRASTYYGGHGLGLYISKTLAKLMNGDLWLGDSKIGTVFYLRLPFKRGEKKEEIYFLNSDA